MSGSELLSLPDACRAVGTSDTTLRRLIATGKLKAHRKQRGKRSFVYVRRPDLLALFGTADAPESGPGAAVLKRGRGGNGGATETPPPAEMVATLRAEVEAKDRDLEALRADLKALRDELREARAERGRLLDLAERLERELAAERKAQRERGVRGLLTEGAKAAADFVDRLRGGKR